MITGSMGTEEYLTRMYLYFVVIISIPALLKLTAFVVCATKMIKHFSHHNTLFSIQLCKGPECFLQNVLTLFEHAKFSEAMEHILLFLSLKFMKFVVYHLFVIVQLP